MCIRALLGNYVITDFFYQNRWTFFASFQRYACYSFNETTTPTKRDPRNWSANICDNMKTLRTEQGDYWARTAGEAATVRRVASMMAVVMSAATKSCKPGGSVSPDSIAVRFWAVTETRKIRVTGHVTVHQEFNFYNYSLLNELF